MMKMDSKSGVDLAVEEAESLLTKSLTFARSVVDDPTDTINLVQVMHMYNQVFSESFYRNVNLQRPLS